MNRSAIAADLRRLLKRSQVIDEPAALHTYGYDASFLTQLVPRPPDVAVIAGSEEDVCAVMRYASERGVPVTPRGAATGQAGGSVALHGGIVLSLNALNRVLEVDVPNMQVFCEPGVVHAQLNEHLAPHRLIFPPDPGSTRMATVGGMAATNAHGMRAVKYGPTGAWV
ncbi:MAG: FAD-binding oxidoreductase, partial [Chloroflexota bacterium]